MFEISVLYPESIHRRVPDMTVSNYNCVGCLILSSYVQTDLRFYRLDMSSPPNLTLYTSYTFALFHLRRSTHLELAALPDFSTCRDGTHIFPFRHTYILCH
jgi:hypothetical protein